MSFLKSLSHRSIQRVTLCALACALATAFCGVAFADTPAAAPAPYTETIPDAKISFDLVAIPGGTFKMGSPAKEKGRQKDEGPQRDVTVRPFWMTKTEVTWDEYGSYTAEGNRLLLKGLDTTGVDAITYPTPPYADETFGYGKNKQPAIAMTQHAAMSYARWLSKKTGKSYRLPTEAEWEYACRAGTDTAYSFGAKADAKALGAFAWSAANSKKHPHPVGDKKPNAFGLFDMHGNVAEWVIDQYDPAAYSQPVTDGLPVAIPGNRRYPHVARGGSWADKDGVLRCAARRGSEKEWSRQDPQNPQSIWWHTEATYVGFRLVRVADEYPALKNLKSKINEESPY